MASTDLERDTFSFRVEFRFKACLYAAAKSLTGPHVVASEEAEHETFLSGTGVSLGSLHTGAKKKLKFFPSKPRSVNHIPMVWVQREECTLQPAFLRTWLQSCQVGNLD